RFILQIMKIINKYFARQLIAIFIMLLLVLTGLAWMIQIMSMMRFLLNYGVALDSFIGLTVLMVPFIISIIIPFVCFIAVIFVYNKLISDNEITVMTASSLSPGQIAKPALVLAVILTMAHLALNLWIVPSTQAQFYNTQWNLRYGLAHMKLQESAFTEITDGLVVYVDKVSGHDLSQVMLSDTREDASQMIIFAEKGKLVSTVRGLSIVMTNGSLQATGDAMTTGTFETFDMDLNVSDNGGDNAFKVRRIPTTELVRDVLNTPTQKQHKKVLAELCTRFLSPIMNLILAALCACILLRSSLLRRRASFAPAMAVLAMAVAMSVFMTASNMIGSLTQFGILAIAQIVVLVVILSILFSKK
ncbi:MAG: LptF/LptG family permease, partial [Lachnospiraceae bacterium]|nr:LptF/LptG family permease [Lachnospiraceae bacterium]